MPPLWDGHAAERIVDVLARFQLEEARSRPFALASAASGPILRIVQKP